MALKNLFGKLSPAPAPSQRLRDNNSYCDCTQTVDVLLRHHKPLVLYDIGAHNGDWSRIVLESVDTDVFIALFEPQKKHFANLVSFFENLPQKKLFNMALGPGRSTSVIKGGGASASLLSASDLQNATFPGSFNESNTEEVEIFSLDEIIEKEKLPFADVIKIDVQGFELDVFKGANNALSRAQYLIVELSFVNLYKGQASNNDLLQFLEQKGFAIIDFGYQWRNRQNEIIQIDAIFKRI